MSIRVAGVKTTFNLIKQALKRDPVRREIFNSLHPKSRTFNPEKAIDLFKERTGLNLHIASSTGLASFASTPGKIIKFQNKGNLPEGVKDIVIGHGTGSTLNDTWVVASTKQKVFDYVNKHISAGKKVLVCCCEETPKKISSLIPKDKAGIGNVVNTELHTARRPAKIVESGKAEIIGDFAKGITKYY